MSPTPLNLRPELMRQLDAIRRELRRVGFNHDQITEQICTATQQQERT
jgi:hypothetical protein